jgi:hypothetical protein
MGSKWALGLLTGGGVEWIHLAQDRDRLWAVVNAVMNLRVLAPRNYLVIDCMRCEVLVEVKKSGVGFLSCNAMSTCGYKPFPRNAVIVCCGARMCLCETGHLKGEGKTEGLGQEHLTVVLFFYHKSYIN